MGILTAVGLVMAALAIYVSNAALAQQDKSTGGASDYVKTRIGLVNLQEVFTKYSKYNSIKEEAKKKKEYWDNVMRKKVERGQQLEKEGKDPKTTAEVRERLARDMTAVKIEVENTRRDASQDLAKFEQQQMAQIYREVEEVVREFAIKYQYDMVFRYYDLSGEERNSDAATVARLNMPLFPMYYDERMDITKYIIPRLNAKHGATSSAPPARDTGTPVKRTNYTPMK